MDRETFADPKVAKYINRNFLPVRINPEKSKENNKLAKKFGVRGYPAHGFTKDGTAPLTVRAGYVPPEAFLNML